MRPEYESSLLRRPEEARLVRTDIFVHELEQGTLETLREAMGRGLTPSSFDFDGEILILRLNMERIVGGITAELPTSARLGESVSSGIGLEGDMSDDRGSPIIQNYKNLETAVTAVLHSGWAVPERAPLFIVPLGLGNTLLAEHRKKQGNFKSGLAPNRITMRSTGCFDKTQRSRLPRAGPPFLFGALGYPIGADCERFYH